jgi:hypothetical protein
MADKDHKDHHRDEVPRNENGGVLGELLLPHLSTPPILKGLVSKGADRRSNVTSATRMHELPMQSTVMRHPKCAVRSG